MKRARLAVTLIGLVLAAALAAPLGEASDLVTGDCSGQQLVQPFHPWLDPASYVLVPGGTFENGTPAWQTDGATIVAGNEPDHVHAATDTNSLALPAGASAVSVPLCATLLHPTLRFFARNTGNALGTLTIDAIANGISVPVALVTGDGTWSPTLPYPFLLDALAPLNGGQLAVSFKFTAQGGNWQIDDVYVDPYESI